MVENKNEILIKCTFPSHSFSCRLACYITLGGGGGGSDQVNIERQAGTQMMHMSASLASQTGAFFFFFFWYDNIHSERRDQPFPKH